MCSTWYWYVTFCEVKVASCNMSNLVLAILAAETLGMLFIRTELLLHWQPLPAPGPPRTNTTLGPKRARTSFQTLGVQRCIIEISFAGIWKFCGSTKVGHPRNNDVTKFDQAVHRSMMPDATKTEIAHGTAHRPCCQIASSTAFSH